MGKASADFMAPVRFVMGLIAWHARVVGGDKPHEAAANAVAYSRVAVEEFEAAGILSDHTERIMSSGPNRLA